MKVDELRGLLKKYTADDLREMIVMLYKIIPKSKKEDSDIDGLLENFEKNTKPIPKEKPLRSFSEISYESETFLKNAMAGNYLAPNRIVNKERRSKWRFEAKRLIKELLAVKGEDSEAAAALLVSFYKCLSYACGTYIFSSDNPFVAIGYSQTDFLDIVLKKLFYSGFTKELIDIAVSMVLNSQLDRETLHIELNYVLANCFETADTKELAVKACDEYRIKMPIKSKKSSSYSSYWAKEQINNAVELYLILKIALFEVQAGIDYYNKYSMQSDKEISLYVLLADYLNDEELYDYWISEYEKAVAKGIKPRDELVAKYNIIKLKIQ